MIHIGFYSMEKQYYVNNLFGYARQSRLIYINNKNKII